MTDFEEVCDWALKTVRLIGDYPDEVVVEAVPGDESKTLRIRANREDVGKVIGRQGRTSQALRILVGAMGKKLKWRFVVEINEGTQSL